MNESDQETRLVHCGCPKNSMHPSLAPLALLHLLTCQLFMHSLILDEEQQWPVLGTRSVEEWVEVHKRTCRSRQSKPLQSIKAGGIRTPRAAAGEVRHIQTHTNTTPVSINNALPSDNFGFGLSPASMLPANGSIILPLAAITIRFDSRLIVAYTHRCHWLLPHSISVSFLLAVSLSLFFNWL